MRHARSAILTLVAALAALAGLVPQAEAATLPSFPMALPVAWGATVQAGGSHTHSSGVRSSVDLGAANNVSVDVVAAADGIASVKPGCSVTVTHADGWETMYYHLKNIPGGLNGAQVVAGQKLGMTGMPGSETCGRGSFRHVHFTLYRGGKEMPINGLSIGGYTVHDTGRAYCGYWTRDVDGTVAADAQRSCLAVPALVNNVVNPGTLAARGSAGPSRSLQRPAISPTDTISAALLYITPGQHSVGGRAWFTECSSYSQTERCQTDIWASHIVHHGGNFAVVEGWTFNNLTYQPMPREAWASNPLGHTGSWVDDEGRAWRTECDTELTGRGGCRTHIMATTHTMSGGQVRSVTQEVFNNMVRFSN